MPWVDNGYIDIWQEDTNPAPVAPPQPTAQDTARSTAEWNAGLNRISQSTPFSTTDYQYTGTDAVGAPQYKQVTQFTQAGQQQISNMLQAQGYASSLLSGIASQADKMLGSNYGADIQTGYGAQTSIQGAIDSYMTSGSAMVNKMFEEQKKGVELDLRNQGVQINSAAYTQAMADFEQRRTDSLSSLSFQAIQTASSRASQAAAFNNQALTQQFNINQSAIAGGQNLFNSLYGAGQSSTNMAAPSYAQVQGVDYNSIANNQVTAQIADSKAAAASDQQFSDMLGKLAAYGAKTTQFQDFIGLKPTT